MVFYLLLCSPYRSEITFNVVTQFLVSVLGFSTERLVFSLTKTLEERGRFTWGAGDTCLALWDIFVFFVVLRLRVSSSLWMSELLSLRFFINSGALSVLASALCGCLTCKTLVVKVSE